MSAADTLPTSTYYINIPIQACYTVTLDELPSDLSTEDILARLTIDALFTHGELAYPIKKREILCDAFEMIQSEPENISIEEDYS